MKNINKEKSLFKKKNLKGLFHSMDLQCDDVIVFRGKCSERDIWN